MPGFSPFASTPVSAIGSYHVVAGGLILRGSNVAPNQWQITSGHLLFGGAIPVAVMAAPRVTWIGLETLQPGVAYSRVTWIGLEVLRTVTTHPTQSVVTWIGLEALHTGVAKARVSWIGIEVLRTIRAADAGWVSLIAA